MWEYRYAVVPDSEWASLEPLNELGTKGWEFAGHIVDGGTATLFLMKRAKR